MYGRHLCVGGVWGIIPNNNSGGYSVEINVVMSGRRGSSSDKSAYEKDYTICH
jgi:hypothetical protein